MNPYACTSAGCELAKNGGLVSFPLVTIAGLIDSLNPCAITMIILLLTSLIIFNNKKHRVLKTGLVYIGSVFITYLLIGFFFYQALGFLGSLGTLRLIINKILGGLLLLAGLINVKDYFLPNIGPHLQIPNSARPFLKKLTEKVSYSKKSFAYPAAALLGVLVTLLETPCSLPIYVGTAKILADAGLGSLGVLGYLLYYNFLFTLPLWIILFIVWRGSEWKIVQLQDFEHRGKKWMKLGLGLMLLVMGIWLIK